LLWMGRRSFWGAVFLFVVVEQISRFLLELATLHFLEITKVEFIILLIKIAFPTLIFAGGLWGLTLLPNFWPIFWGGLWTVFFFVEENYRLKGKIWQELSLFWRR